MELRKTNENINRSFDAEGQSQDRVDSINYEIRDADGNVIGNASVNNGNAYANINIYGFATIAEGEARLKEILGIEAPNH